MSPAPPPGIEDQAAAWDARLRSPDAGEKDRAGFQDWLAADPAHAAAFDELQAALAALREHAAHPQLSALRDQGRAAAAAARARRGRRRIGWGLAAAGLCGLVVLAAARLAPAPSAPLGGAGRPDAPAGARLYQTALNERSTVSLQDGSTVTLDSGARLAARFLPARREIVLLQGQALFHVAKDASRPFVVRAGGRTVTALGTVFDVRLDRGRMRVTLLEGKVAVRELAPRAGAAARVDVLHPGQELAEQGGAAPLVRSVDVARATSWTEGRLYLEDEPLAQAVEELNRYSAAKVVLADPSLGQLRVNGMFRTDNQTGFVAALQATLPVEARTDDQGRILLQRR